MGFDKEKYELTSLRGTRKNNEIQTVPINMGNGLGVYPITIGEIEEIGEHNYNTYVRLLTLSVEEIDSILNDETDLSDVIDNTYDFLISYCLQGEIFKEMVENAISFFLKKTVFFIKGTSVFAVEKHQDSTKFDFINNVNYVEFVDIIKYQNCIEKKNVDAFNPKNKKAEQIKAKIELAQKEIKKLKKKSENESLTLADLVSVLSSSENDNGISLFNVWELTIYQFNDQFNRMKMLEDFKINIQQLLAGADSDKIKLKDWMQKIQ